jgi:uncharacterized protein YecA (UPF0149 family)
MIENIDTIDPIFCDLIKKVIIKEIPVYIIGKNVIDKNTKKKVTIERNEICPCCNSEKKYKKCCGKDLT